MKCIASSGPRFVYGKRISKEHPFPILFLITGLPASVFFLLFCSVYFLRFLPSQAMAPSAAAAIMPMNPACVEAEVFTL